MLKKQLLLVATIIGLAVGIYVILQLLNWNNPHTNISNKLTPNDLLVKSMSAEKLISVDELTAKIINEDPSYTLIDLRDKIAFDKFTLPNAINIKPSAILNDENKSFYNDAHNVVLFSNGSNIANKVWMLLRREGFRNIMVLDGGLNQFYKTIMNPTKPTSVASEEAFELYNFRKAAGVYFGLPNPNEFIPEKEIVAVEKTRPASRKRRAATSVDTKVKKAVKLQVKPKPSPKEEEEEDEGC